MRSAKPSTTTPATTKHMDKTNRSTPRQYPTFGEVPAAVKGSPELRLEAEGATASLSGFVCSPSGLSMTLRTAVLVEEGGGVSYAFAERLPASDAVEVWAASPEIGVESGQRLHAHLIGGGGGTEGTLHAAMFHLWLPIDVTALVNDVTIGMAWPTLDETVRLDIPAALLRQAAARADLRFVDP